MLAGGARRGSREWGGRPAGSALTARSAPPGSARSPCARRWVPRLSRCASALGSALSPQPPSSRPGLF